MSRIGLRSWRTAAQSSVRFHRPASALGIAQHQALFHRPRGVRPDEKSLGIALAEPGTKLVLDLEKERPELVRRRVAPSGLGRPLELAPELPREELALLVAPAPLEVDHRRADLVDAPESLVGTALDLVHLHGPQLGGRQIAGVLRKPVARVLAGVEHFPLRRDANRVDLEPESTQEAQERQLVLVGHEKGDVGRHGKKGDRYAIDARSGTY